MCKIQRKVVMCINSQKISPLTDLSGEQKSAGSSFSISVDCREVLTEPVCRKRPI